MARPIRINIRNGYYHVINRGRNRMKIFRRESDYKEFLKLLGECYDQYKVHVIAYCLMSNHYHLLVRAPNANLPQFMRQLNGVYTQIFNRKYKYDGTLFRGRYKAIVVQEEFFLMRVVRYIHLNPKKAGMVKDIKDYQYSSHKNYIEKDDKYRWLRLNEMYDKEWMAGKRGIKAYTQFMSGGDDKELEDFYKAKKRASILGEKEYTDELKQRYIYGKRYYDREIPQEHKIRQQQVAEEIEGRVSKLYGVDKGSLKVASRGQDNEPRKVAIKLIRDKTGMSCKGVSERYQIGNPRSVSEYCRRIKNKYSADKIFRELYKKIESSLQVET